MPQGGVKLPEADITRIRDWIDLGAPYDAPLVKSKVKAISWTEKVVAPEAKQFWSLQPLAQAAPPVVKNTTWGRTPPTSTWRRGRPFALCRVPMRRRFGRRSCRGRGKLLFIMLGRARACSTLAAP